MREIAFDTTTLWLQIHGLPPAIIHEGTAEKIGSRVGFLHPETVNRRSVVAHRYLRVRVDIPINNPILAGYFYERVKNDELWVQFKYERLPDFCFRCGLLDHVTGRCRFKTPATITSAHGVTAKAFGPWLKAEVVGTVDFVNTPEEDGNRKREIQKKEKLEMVVFDQGNRYLLDESPAMSHIAEGKETH